MRILSKIFTLIACSVMILVSCSKDKADGIQLDENLKVYSDFENHIIDKVGLEAALEIFTQMNSPVRTPISYNGQLCEGDVHIGTAPSGGVFNLALGDFWYFTGNAGDLIGIDVDRITCEMDPIFYVYEGYGDTGALTYAASADDNDPAACETCFAFFDPSFSGFALPSTGTYTLVVWDWASCAPGDKTYSVSVTGIVCDSDGDGCNDDVDPHPNSNISAEVMIDGCSTGVDNVFVTQCSTMMDLITDCAAGASNHGQFVSCVAALSNEWKHAGLISGREHGKIMRCAATSSLP